MILGTVVSRGCAVLLLIAVLLALWHISIAPLRQNWVENNAKLEARSDLLRQWKRKLAVLETHKTLVPGELSARFKSHYVDAKSDVLAGAKLQTSIRTILARNKITLRAAQALAPKKMGSLRSFGVRLQLDGRLKAIYRLLYDLENHVPFLFIERLLLRRQSSGRPVASSAKGGLDHVAATLEVFAMRLPPTVTTRRTIE